MAWSAARADGVMYGGRAHGAAAGIVRRRRLVDAEMGHPGGPAHERSPDADDLAAGDHSPLRPQFLRHGRQIRVAGEVPIDVPGRNSKSKPG